MQADKVKFIHFRDVDANGEYVSKGGATVAWMIDPATLDIEIGFPAIINPVDAFVKSTNRVIALDNLFSNKLVVITKYDYVTLAIEEINAAPNILNAVCSKQLYSDRITDIIYDITNFPLDSLNSSWFETLVRDYVAYLMAGLRDM